MTLTKRLLTFGSAALLGWNVLTLDSKRLDVSSALAQENVSCEQIIDKYETKLEGSFWGLGSGCLDKFEPERADKSDYQDSFKCVKDFLEEYDEKKCGRNELYDKSITAMLRNLFTKDEVTRTWVRNILYTEGVLNHQRQLERIVDSAEEIKKKAGAMKGVYSQADLTQRKELRRRLNSWQAYLKDLRVQAVLTVEQALFLRERPEKYSLDEIDEDMAEGINLSHKTLDALVSLEGHLAEENWGQVYDDFKEWKKDQEDIYANLINVLNKGLAFGLFEVETYSGKSERISYLDVDGKWQTTWASKEFARQWGNNGENYYSKVEEIDKIIKEVEEVDLRKAVVREGGFRRRTAEARVAEEYNPCVPSTEICDGLDNNCNGEVDEGNVCGCTLEDLVGYWKFDESSGNIAHDSSGEGNDGMVYGASWTTGKVNGALNFSGSSYVEVPYDASLDLGTGSLTLGFWMNGTAKKQGIMHQWSGKGFYIQTDSVNMDILFSDGVKATNIGIGNLPVNDWHYIVAVLDRNTQKGRSYLDGVEDINKDIPIEGSLSNNSPLKIGHIHTSPSYYSGKLDEIKIYNCALSAEQVAEEWSRAWSGFRRRTAEARVVEEDRRVERRTKRNPDGRREETKYIKSSLCVPNGIANGNLEKTLEFFDLKNNEILSISVGHPYKEPYRGDWAYSSQTPKDLYFKIVSKLRERYGSPAETALDGYWKVWKTPNCTYEVVKEGGKKTICAPKDSCDVRFIFSEKKEKKRCIPLDVYRGDLSANLTYFGLDRSEIERIESKYTLLHFYPGNDIVYNKIVSKLNREFGKPDYSWGDGDVSWSGDGCDIYLKKDVQHGINVLVLQGADGMRKKQ